jgi:sulfur-oxidizing protein SoxZ
MAKKSIKIRAKLKGGETTVKALMNHPMETGLRKDKKTGKPIPAHFINEVIAKSGGKTVMTAYWSGAISKNPYISFKFTGGAKGDDVEISWTDNQGGSDSASAKIK